MFKSQSQLKLPDSANGRVMGSKIICAFVSVPMRFLSVPHVVNAFRAGDIRFLRSYLLASFGYVQNFKRTPPDKDVWWLNVTCGLV